MTTKINPKLLTMGRFIIITLGVCTVFFAFYMAFSRLYCLETKPTESSFTGKSGVEYNLVEKDRPVTKTLLSA